MSTPLLTLTGIRAGFGSQTIIHGIDLEVPAGQVTGLFGLNGAGKSVLLKVVAGVVPTWGGRIQFLGNDITTLSPERRVALGMAHVPQGRQVFPSLTVEQNLRVGGYVLDRRDRAAFHTQLERVYEMFPLLAERRRQYAGTLSGGQQAMLAVGRALISDPKLVLIDEPSAGLAPAIVEQLLESLLGIRELGLTMLLVEQNIRFGLRLSNQASLLQRGRVVYSGKTADLDHDTLASYLGVGRLLSKDLSAGLKRTSRSR
ncbi:MAG: branched-chain amino acid transport system ATP-binding protein [Frankiales bacterium]|jgi:branched-chain amino acid transport system ATP-binding protein|nr:branched-chain amino acid transport system ATP-binding protein [Frankiales bacterium]